MRNLLSLFIVLLIFSCSKDDPCDGISCQNGGVCINGQCDCPDGYSGPDCGTKETPFSIKVVNIKVTRFPATDSNGGGWDLTSGPDIYVQMTYNNQVIYKHEQFYQNANPSQKYNFLPSSNLLIYNPEQRYVVSLYDHDDFDADDFMGGIEFTPYNANRAGFPNMLSLDAGGAVSFELSLEYSF